MSAPADALEFPATDPPAVDKVAEADTVVIGGGPAGLMAAEALLAAGRQVELYDAMPSVGRKFLLAGRGGLNLTHGEALPAFMGRFREAAGVLAPWLQEFGPQAVRDWAAGLGVATFVGSSGRVFPVDFKAAPLLRAWLHRLRADGLRLHMRHRWQGWDGAGRLCLQSPQGLKLLQARATMLALGGGSWPHLGSDGAWPDWLEAVGVAVRPLQPANCGFEVAWSDHLRQRHAGAPLKGVAASWDEADGARVSQRGECVLSDYGIEGSLIYAASAALREAVAREGRATLWLDLLPTRTLAEVEAELRHPRGSRSLSTHLKSRLGLHGAKVALLREVLPRERLADPAALAAAIKALPLAVGPPRPLAETISSAGGVPWAELDGQLMLRRRPGVFCAGEMLDWEAPTGGYLLTACLATGRVAGRAAAAWPPPGKG